MHFDEQNRLCEWNPDRLETDDEDLMRTIYAYFCNSGYPHRLQEAIDTTIQILDSVDNTYLEIEALIMELAGAADLWGFQQGFRAAVELLSGNTFRKIFDKEEPNGKYYQQAKETAAVTAIAMIRDGVPPVDIRICIDNWYGVEIPEHAMKILEAEAKSDEEEEQLTGKRRTDLSPSSRYNRCWDIRKAKRLHEYSISPDVIHCTYPDLSEAEIENICSNVDDDETKIDDLTLRKLQETVKTPLKTTEERVAYLRGRSDKAREVIQNLYCNHGGNAHSIYDFFQDDVIKYEEIIGWKQEAADYMERETTKRIARRTAVQMLQGGQTPNEMNENIEKWFSVRFSDVEIISLRRQASLNKCISEMSVTLDEEGKAE